MKLRKQSYHYYFSVEGETEKLYFQWLQKIINETEMSKIKVNFVCKKQPDPTQMIKSLNIICKTEIYHIADYESNDEEHTTKFNHTIDNLKKARSMGKNITYKFGYSNFTFDLWIILHKIDCNNSFNNSNDYIKSLNKAYSEKFISMKAYKQQDNFNNLLNKLTIDDVIQAIKRAKKIMDKNENEKYKLYEYKGYNYYKENPSLMVWEPVEKILKDCGLLSP